MHSFKSRLAGLALLPLLATPAAAQDPVSEEPAPTPPISDVSGGTAGFDRSRQPGPLADRPFQLPNAVTAELSNGLDVVLVENHEVPLVWVQLVTNRGGWTDPAGKRGLASAAMDMLNEGAGGMTAEELSAASRRIGAAIEAGAGLDGGVVATRVIRRNLEPALDLMQKVVLEPDFPQDDWELLRKKRLQDLKAAREDPGSIASRVFSRLMYGDHYAGILTSEQDYNAITVADLRSWYESQVSPTEAMILVGGDVTMDAIKPLLEARFGGWQPEGDLPELEMPSLVSARNHNKQVIHLVDRPGAAQSVIRIGTFVGEETESDWEAFNLANLAIGGQFTARINMNLREDKGITYGARSSTEHNYLPGLWTAGASVVTDKTDLGVTEILKEVREARDGRPVTRDELEAARGGLLGTWPLSFENPGYLLDETVEIWRYGRPTDWLTRLIPRYEAVTLEAANTAFNRRVDPGQLVILVVGDAAKVRPALEKATGLPVVMLDADGNPVQ